MADEPIKEEGQITRMTIELREPEVVALSKLQEQEPYKTLNASRTAIIRVAILDMARAASDKENQPATKRDFKALASEIVEQVEKLSKTKVRNTEPTVPAVRPTKADRTETMAEEGKERCERMGGTVNGNVCIYKKYEVLASGRAVSYDVTSPLATLSEADERGQYDPSKEQWEKADAES